GCGTTGPWPPPALPPHPGLENAVLSKVNARGPPRSVAPAAATTAAVLGKINGFGWQREGTRSNQAQRQGLAVLREQGTHAHTHTHTHKHTHSRSVLRYTRDVARAVPHKHDSMDANTSPRALK